jgi:hypothetical protein
MHQISHQTVKLGKGKHSSPEYGACVMELASMLAGEPFSDHPSSVSPAIAAFLRAYNDMLDDERRQDLYEYAARTVGTAISASVEEVRAGRLVAWGDEQRQCRASWSVLGRFKHRASPEGRWQDSEAAARYAVQAIRKVTEEVHIAALSLLDDLINIGVRPRPSPPGRARSTSQAQTSRLDPDVRRRTQSAW